MIEKDDKCTPVFWVSPALNTLSTLEGKWRQSGWPTYTTFQYTKYTKANFLESHPLPGDGTQIKQQPLHPQTAMQKPTYLSGFLHLWERKDDLDHGFLHVGHTWALMTTLNQIQLHWISWRPRVPLSSLKAVMSSQYLCGLGIQDSSHIVLEVQIRNQPRGMQWIHTKIDFNTLSTIMSPHLHKRLGLPQYVVLTKSSINTGSGQHSSSRDSDC